MADDDDVADDDDTAANNAPLEPGIGLSPAVAYDGYQPLVCEVQSDSFDLDFDTITYTVSWTRDGTPWTGGVSTTTETGDTIAASDLGAFELWECSVEPFDGTETGDSGTASLVVQPGGFWEQLSGAGWGRMCGLLAGEGYCWGEDAVDSHTNPVASAVAAPWVEIANGSNYWCVREAGGTVECADLDGPPLVPPAGSYIALAGADRGVCGVLVGGALECWGDDYFGIVSGAPTGGSWSSTIAAGEAAVCALDSTTGDPTCWGAIDPLLSSTIPLGGGFSDLAVIYSNAACAVNGVGELDCWGVDVAGVLSTVPSGSDWTSVRGGYAAGFCALDGAGAIICWGDDTYGQVSDVPGWDGWVDVQPGTTGPAPCTARARSSAGACREAATTRSS